MKRLGSGSKSQRAMGKREKQKLQQQQQDKDKAASASGGGGGGATSGGPQQTADVLVRMTEIADRLLLEGEVGGVSVLVYTHTYKRTHTHVRLNTNGRDCRQIASRGRGGSCAHTHNTHTRTHTAPVHTRFAQAHLTHG